MLVQLSRKDCHIAHAMGVDTVALCKMQGFSPRLENPSQTREEANAYGYKAEFAVARLFDCELPQINVASDGGVDLWVGDVSIDVKFTNKEYGQLIFDSLEKFRSRVAVLVGKTSRPDVMRINGWISKREFGVRHYRHDFGYGERLVMDYDKLNTIETLWKKFAEIKHSPRIEVEQKSNAP